MSRKRKNRKLKKSYLILVDGESEQIYINKLKSSNITVKPEIPIRKSLIEMYNYFKQSLELYDEVYWIVDLDVVIKKNRLNDFQNYKNSYPNNIIINHPCLEYWFVLHYELNNIGNSCSSIIRWLKNQNEFKTYKKNDKEITKIIQLLKPKLPTAIYNAKNRVCDLNSIANNCSQMYILFDKKILNQE